MDTETRDNDIVAVSKIVIALCLIAIPAPLISTGNDSFVIYGPTSKGIEKVFDTSWCGENAGWTCNAVEHATVCSCTQD